jgi:hypothetical protein
MIGRAGSTRRGLTIHAFARVSGVTLGACVVACVSVRAVTGLQLSAIRRQSSRGLWALPFAAVGAHCNGRNTQTRSFGAQCGNGGVMASKGKAKGIWTRPCLTATVTTRDVWRRSFSYVRAGPTTNRSYSRPSEPLAFAIRASGHTLGRGPRST